MDYAAYAHAETSITTATANDAFGDYQPANHQVEGIQAIAAKIHERAIQLANEQELLRNAEQELSMTQLTLAKEKGLRQDVRIQFLKTMSKANALEIECIKIEELIKDRVLKTQKNKEKEIEINNKVSKNEAIWDKTEESLTRHKLRQELYLKILRGVIDKRNQAIMIRKIRIETATRLREESKRECDSIALDQTRIEAEMAHISETEKGANVAVEALASKVRETIAKVRV
jgi:hypothetical protein